MGLLILRSRENISDLILRGCECISDLILRSGHLAASRRMAANSGVASILRDACFASSSGWGPDSRRDRAAGIGRRHCLRLPIV